jgi:hypothetical protein
MYLYCARQSRLEFSALETSSIAISFLRGSSSPVPEVWAPVLVEWGGGALVGFVAGCPPGAVEGVDPGVAVPPAEAPLDVVPPSVLEDPLVAVPVPVPPSVAEFAEFPASPSTVLIDRPVEAAVGVSPLPEGVTTTTTPTAIAVTAVAATASAVFGVNLFGGLVTRTSIGARRAATQIRVLSVLRCATNTVGSWYTGKRYPAYRLRTGCSRRDEAESRAGVCAASSCGPCVAVS